MASIPLPALHVNPPQDPTEGIQRFMALKGMLQQQAGQQQIQQQRAIEIQNAQMQQQDQIKLRQLFIKHQGDLDKVIADAPQAGVSPQTIQGLQLHNVDVKTKTADLVSKQGANALQQADLINGAHDAVDKAPADQKAAVYQQQLQSLGKMGIDISQMPPEYPGDEQFKLVGAMVKGHKQQVEDAAKQAGISKDQAQAAEATARTAEVTANTGKIQAEINFYQKRGLAPGVPLDAQEAADWMQKNPGKTVSDYMQFKAKLVPAFNFNLQNQGATGGSNGQPSAMAKAIADGSLAWKDAVSPRTPMNVKTALLAEVKQINPNFKSSDFEVEKKVQEKYTSGNAADQLTAINTAREHMATFKQTAAALNNGDFKLANQVGNWLGTEFGSDKATNFNVARSAFAGEVGKAFAGANVGVSDRQELIDKINAASSWDQLKGYADTADKLLEGKQKSLKEGFTQGMQGKPNFGSQPAPAATNPGGFDWSRFPKVNQ